MSTSGDDMLSDKDDSRKSSGKKQRSKAAAAAAAAYNVVASPSAVIKSLESPRGSLTTTPPTTISHLIKKKDCPLSDPNYYMYSRQRSNREELDFTSNRKQSESNKKKMMEEFHKEQPLIQDKIIQELTATFKHASRNKKLTSKNREISKSHGDGLDDQRCSSTAKSRKAKRTTSGSKSKESLRDIGSSRDELDKIEDDYAEVNSAAFSTVSQQQKSSTGPPDGSANIGAPSGFSDSSKGGGEGLSSTYSQETRQHNSRGDQELQEKNSLIGAMIEPPDLFNTNKIKRSSGTSASVMKQQPSNTARYILKQRVVDSDLFKHNLSSHHEHAALQGRISIITRLRLLRARTIAAKKAGLKAQSQGSIY